MDPDFEAPEERRRVDYVAAFRRRWWVIALLGVIGLLAGLVVTELMPKTYEATAQVQVTPTGAEDTTSSQTTTASRTTDGINLDTETQLVTSTPVAERAANALHRPGQGFQLVKNNVSVVVPANTEILAISFRDSTALKAQQGAMAFAQGYLDDRAATASATIAARVKGLTGQRDALATQLQNVAGQVASLAPSSTQHTFAASQQTVLSQQVANLNNDIAQLQGTPITPGSIVLAAHLPTSPSSPILPLNLASGLVAGLLIGALLVFLGARPRPGRKIAHIDELNGLFDGPVVLAGSAGGGRKSGTDKRLARRRYQELANTVLFLGQREPTIVLVTGATGGPVGAVAATGIAEAVARRGLRTALIDADLDSGTLSAMSASRGAPGLSEVLLGERPLEEVATRPAGSQGYELVPVGPRAIEAAPLAQVPRLRRIFDAFSKSVDILIVSAPSTADSLEAELLAGLADGVIIAVEANHSRQADVEDAVEQMRAVGTPVLGAVLMGRDSAGATAGAAGTGRAESKPRAGRHGSPRTPGEPLPSLSRAEVEAFERAAKRESASGRRR